MKLNTCSSLRPLALSNDRMPERRPLSSKHPRSETLTISRPQKKQKCGFALHEPLSPTSTERTAPRNLPVLTALKGNISSSTLCTAKPSPRQTYSKTRHRGAKPTYQVPHGVIGISSLQFSPEVKRSARHGGPDLSDLRGVRSMPICVNLQQAD